MSKSNVITADIAVIGGGSGGLSVAAGYFTPTLFSARTRRLVGLLQRLD